MTRANQLQRMHARGNTAIVPTYRDGPNDSQVYLGHHAKFAVRWRSPLTDNVSRIRIGERAPAELVEALVGAGALRATNMILSGAQRRS